MCPTCGHTVQRVNEGVSPKTWWCPRCGTLKTDGVPEHEPTQLTKRLIACSSGRDADRVVQDFMCSLTEEAHQQRPQS